MNIEKIIANAQEEVKNLNISPDNLILAITKLLEITHAHNLDREAVTALAECGITLEIDEV
jgi:EAL domain-containing protein (putative c-di-GMP-specific phosphodiesterase class I)